MTTIRALTAGAVALGMAYTAAAQEASLSIEVRATVPVTCSSGTALSRDIHGTSVVATFDARCNAPHEVRVFSSPSTGAAVTITGADTGYLGQTGAAFIRPAYFDAVTVVTVDAGSAQAAEQIAQTLSLQLTPLA